MAEARSADIFPVLVVNFIGALGFSIVMPFLVFLVIDFGGNAVVYGFVGATYSTFQFFGAPLLGRWSDTYGRRRILLLSQAGTLIAWLLFVVALLVPRLEVFRASSGPLGEFVLTAPLLVLFVARAVDGLTGGNISVANAYASDVSTKETRSANFGRMGVSFNLGMVIGPALAGVLGATRYGEMIPVLLAVAISSLALVVIYFRLPESNRRAQRGPVEGLSASRTLGAEPRDCELSRQCPKRRRRRLLAEPTLFFVVTVFFIVMLGFNLFYASFPMHAARSLGFDAMTIGVFFAILSGTLVVVEGPVLTWLSPRSSETTRIVGGLLVLAAGFVVFWAARGWTVYAAALLFAFGNGVAWPSLTSFLAGLVDDSIQGSVQGLASSAGSLASIIGLLAGGVIYERFHSVTFLLSASLILLASLLSMRLAGLRSISFESLEPEVQAVPQ